MANKKGPGRRKKYASGKINALVEWKKRPFLDKMIDDGTPAKELVAWCKENGFAISLPTMYTYMKQRNEAIVNGLTMELLQPKNDEDHLKKALEEASKKGGEQNKVNRREDRAKAKQIMADAMEQVCEQESPKRNRHDLELLDEVIQRLLTR